MVVINTYLSNQAKDITGCSFDELLKVLDTGRPIVVWVTIGMDKTKINSTWHDTKGNKVIWKVQQHTILLVGYTKNKVIFNDPLSEKSITTMQFLKIGGVKRVIKL